MSQRDRSVTLPRAGLLADASDETLEELAAIATPVTLAKGEVLFEHGDDGESLYVISSGSLEISVVSSEGRKLVLDVMHSGDVLGEIALLDPGRRTAGIAALERSELLSITRGNLVRAVDADPQLGLEIARMAARRLRWVSQQLHEQVFLPLPERLARKLIHLSRGEDVLKMSQNDLADFVGATRESVSKILSQWRQEGIVDLGRQKVFLRDQAAIQALSRLEDV
ncbi:MAG: Crp/Fnr family transcriptional regulator [Paracoccaceae bacterium]